LGGGAGARPMKVFITGAGGMLARSVARALETSGHDVLALRRDDADVTQYDALIHPIRTFRPDWIFHLGAFTKVDECESRPDHAYLVNGLGSKNVALAAAECAAAVLTISSDYVFGGDASRPYREYDPPAPRSVYGASKWAGEQSVREVNPHHLIVRTSWLFGRGGPNFIDTILTKGRAGEPLKVVDDQRGSPTWTHDLARGLIDLVDRRQYGTYHCTNSGDGTWYDLAAYALERAGVKTSLERTDSATFQRPAPRPAYSVLDSHWFDHVTGRPMPPWQDAVDRYLESIRAHA
jgi:dTDP-4-dehydrorhamnose reductase